MFYGSYGGNCCPTQRQVLPHPPAPLAPPSTDVGQMMPHPQQTSEGSNPTTMNEAPELNALCHRVSSLALLPGTSHTDGKTDSDGRRIYWTLAYDSTSTDLHGTRMTADAFQGSAEALDFPIILFHNKSSFPVAKPVSVEYDERGLNVGFVFASTPEARIAEELVAGGFLRGVSVGFIPRDGYIDEEDGATVFTKADLIELSLTPTPSSRKALIDLTRSLGEDPEELAAFLDTLSEEMDTPAERPGDLKAPAYMAESAARGLELYEEGLGGDGLVEDTITEARQMAAGEELSADKWKRIGPWIARHMTDLEGVEPGDITPGVVAMLLWGGGATMESAKRAMDYANEVANSLEEDRAPGDRIVVSDLDDTLTTEAGVVIETTADYLRNLDSEGVKVFIVSGRSDSRMDETREWLETNNIPHAEIHLSDFPEGPNASREYKLYKAGLLLEAGYVIVSWLENDAQTRAALGDLGINTVNPSTLEKAAGYDQHAHALDLLRALGVEESLLSLITKPGTKTLADDAAEQRTEEPTSKQAATLDSARERAHRNLALIRRHRLR